MYEPMWDGQAVRPVEPGWENVFDAAPGADVITDIVHPDWGAMCALRPGEAAAQPLGKLEGEEAEKSVHGTMRRNPCSRKGKKREKRKREEMEDEDEDEEWEDEEMESEEEKGKTKKKKEKKKAKSGAAAVLATPPTSTRPARAAKKSIDYFAPPPGYSDQDLQQAEGQGCGFEGYDQGTRQCM